MREVQMEWGQVEDEQRQALLHLPVAYLMTEPSPSPGGFVESLCDTGLKTPYFHLWFLAHPLVYSIGYVLLRRRSERVRHGRSPAWPVPTPAAIVWFVVALTLVTWVVRIPFPIDVWWPIFFVVASEPAHPPQSAALFAPERGGQILDRGGSPQPMPRTCSISALSS